jgi:G6PDH family F420-dependent oxidoreductase
VRVGPDGPGREEDPVTKFGYTLMTEQAGPRDLVRHAVGAEEVGFDFEVMSDHFSPWLTSQGHAPYAWSVLGAVAHATSRVGLMTYVTCPSIRYHPAVVAQKSATVQLLAEGRFTLGLGSGESLNEHVVGDGWPGIETRQEMLSEAVEIIRQLHTGDLVTFRGDHFDVDSARIWDTPETPVEIAVAVAGDRAISHFAPLADHLVGVEPDAELVSSWNAVDGAPRIGDRARAIGQIPICWDPDEQVAIERAHDQFRWFAGGWSVNADLPTPAGFAAATQFVRPADVASNIPCGPDLDKIVESVSAFWEAGFTDVALVQIGGDTQDRFLDEAARPLLEKLRAARRVSGRTTGPS